MTMPYVAWLPTAAGAIRDFSRFVMLTCVLLAGCSQQQQQAETGEPPLVVAPVDTAASALSAAEVRRKLKEHNAGFGNDGQFETVAGEIRRIDLSGTAVADISALAGLPLQRLDLSETQVSDLSPLQGMQLAVFLAEKTRVSDISPLKGMPLETVWLKETDVADISALAGMQLTHLMLFGTKVTDISVLSSMTVNTLWLTDTEVSDLRPLEGKSLESLDIQGTAVADIKVLAEMTSLRRLNIVDSQVTDLSALVNLSLDRLVFRPHLIQSGLQAARKMSSLKELGTSLEARMPPNEFWAKFDAGAFQDKTE